MIDQLNDMAPNAALAFTGSDLHSNVKYWVPNYLKPNSQGDLRYRKVFVHQRGIGPRKAVRNERKLTDGTWALMDSMCEYGNPSNAYTWEQVKQ